MVFDYRRDAEKGIRLNSLDSKSNAHITMIEDREGPSPSGSQTGDFTRNNTTMTNEEPKALFDGEVINLIPMPTADPKDPLNLPGWKKLVAIASLCLFGAMAAAAELILGAMLPVFSFEYAGIDPKNLVGLKLPPGSNGLAELANFPGPPLWKIYLLASLPVLMMGLSNFLLVPAAIAMGRRTIILGCGVIAVVGCIWAGFSESLDSHLGARCIQALGAGTVESLIPFILQDMVFYHQRNQAIGAVFAVQGLIIVTLGISAPYVIAYASWRWIYWITAGVATFFLAIMFFVLPETRYHRTEREMKGISETPLRPGQQRPDLDFVNYTPRTLAYDIAFFHGRMEWREGAVALWDTFRTFFYPHIFFITMLNSAMIAVALAGGYTAAPELLTDPWGWPFLHLGFCLFPIIVAALLSFVISGYYADKFANWLAKKRGRRDPEIQALNLIFPCVVGLAGSLVFGFAGAYPDQYHWMVFITGLGMVVFGFLATNTIGIVYVLESYPHLAGPALVNIASFRCLIAFVLSFRVSEWVAELGYLKTFTIYAVIIGVFLAFIPVIWFFGASWRKRWPALPKNQDARRSRQM